MKISMLINGERTKARDGAFFERRNPLDDSVATEAPAATIEDARAAVQACVHSEHSSADVVSVVSNDNELSITASA